MSKFSYCLNGSTIRTTPVLEQIAVAAKAGYAGIELWLSLELFREDLWCGNPLEVARVGLAKMREVVET